ncbi:hypothetical protein IL306_006322 [Fusarium sp. DS 682]|nr:hypothetical protein IL306_006322 [Fusarium sp. DS 682]
MASPSKSPKKRTISQVSKSPQQTPPRDIDQQVFELRPPPNPYSFTDAHFAVSNLVEDESEEPTPRASSVRHHASGLSRPLLPPPHNAPSVITTRSPQPRSRGESSNKINSGSPTKSTSRASERSAAKSTPDLGVTTPAFTFNKKVALPSDLEALKRAKAYIKVVPAVVKEEIEAMLTATASNDEIYPWNIDDMDKQSRQAALVELGEIHRIYNRAQYCAGNNAPEANWNDSVTAPILELALRDMKGLIPHNITCLSSQKSLLPKGGNGEPVEGRQIDYSINLAFDHDLELKNLTTKLFRKLPNRHMSLNQSFHQLVRHRPAAINIETKATTASDGRPQLAVWISAWMEQIRILKSWASCPDGKEPVRHKEPFELYMPLILAEKHT